MEVVREAQFASSTELSLQRDFLSMALLTQLLVVWASDRIKGQTWEAHMKTSEEKPKTDSTKLFLPSFVECEGVGVTLNLGDKQHSFAEGDLFSLEPLVSGGALLSTQVAQSTYQGLQRRQQNGFWAEPVAVGVFTEFKPEIKATVAPSQMTGSISKVLQGLDVNQVRWLLRPIPPLATVDLCWKAVSGKWEKKDDPKMENAEGQRNEILEALHVSFSSGSLHQLLAKLRLTWQITLGLSGASSEILFVNQLHLCVV